MGILSSLFQTGAPAPQVAGPMLGTSKLPEELAPYYKDILGKAQALYNERTKEGFQPYQGPTIADFTPEQQQAFTGISGLVGQQAPVFQEAMDMTRAAAAPMTSEQVTEYMSPYQQAVVDIEKREAQKQYESQVVPQLAAKAATTGGFGGSRQAILEGMAADTQQRLLSDIQAKGSQQAYQDAVKRFQADRQAAGRAGAQLATMAPQQFKAQLGELGAVQTIGEEKQRQQQTALDEAFRQYQLERNFPYDTMGQYQAVVTGAPVRPTTFAKPADPTPSIGQQLMGGLGTLVGTYGAFGGKLPQVFAKKGGGLNDLPVVYRQTNGQILDRSSIANLLGMDLSGINEFKIPSDVIYTKKHNIPPSQQFKTQSGETLHPFFRRAMQAGIPAGSAFEVSIGEGGKPVFSVVDTNQPVEKESLEQKVENKIDSAMPFDLSNYNLSPRAGVDDTTFQLAEQNLEGTRERYLDLNKKIDELIAANPLKSADEIKNEITTKFNVSRDQISNYVDNRKNQLATQLKEDEGEIESFYKDQEGTITEFLEKKEGRIDAQESDATQRISDFYDGKTTRMENRKDLLESNLKQRELEDEAERAAFYGDRETALKAREAANKEELNRQQYANLAMFFARLGTAAPKQEGLAGVLGAGLEAAEETIPDAAATRAAYKDSQDKIADRREILALNKRGDKLKSTAQSRNMRDAIDSFIYSEEGDIASGRHVDTETLIDRINNKKEELLNKEFELTNNNALRKRTEKQMSVKENRNALHNLEDKFFNMEMDINDKEFALLLNYAEKDFENATKLLSVETMKADNLDKINNATMDVLEAKVNLLTLDATLNTPDFQKFVMSPDKVLEYSDKVLNEEITAIKKALPDKTLDVYTYRATADVIKTLQDNVNKYDLTNMTQLQFGNMVLDRVIQIYKADKGRDLLSEITNKDSVNQLNPEGNVGPNKTSDVLKGLQ
jgi:hypothetical protein